MRKTGKDTLFEEERLTEWFKRGREKRKEAKGLLQRHCRHGFQLVEKTNKGYLQICAKCFNTLFV